MSMLLMEGVPGADVDDEHGGEPHLHRRRPPSPGRGQGPRSPRHSPVNAVSLAAGLAFFLQALDGSPEILLPGLSWGKELLEELAGRARRGSTSRSRL